MSFDASNLKIKIQTVLQNNSMKIMYILAFILKELWKHFLQFSKTNCEYKEVIDCQIRAIKQTMHQIDVLDG